MNHRPETFLTRTAAEAWLNRVWAPVADDIRVHPGTQRRLDEEDEYERSLRALTVADWVDTWLDEVGATCTADTLRKCRSDLRVVEEGACDGLVDPAFDGRGLVSVVVEVGVGHLVQEDGDGLPVDQGARWMVCEGDARRLPSRVVGGSR